MITSDSSWDSMSSLSDFDIDESENSSEESSESIPVISRKRSTRTKKQVKSKSRNRSNGVGKKSNRSKNNQNIAGPSSASNSSNNSNLNRGQRKRKCKEKPRILDCDESSSDSSFSQTIQRSRVKRLRRSDLDTDESDSSTILCPATRRTGFIQSESSDTSSECIIRPAPRRTRAASSSVLSWSDNSDSTVVNGDIDTVNSFSPVRVVRLAESRSSSTSSSSSSSSLFSDNSTGAGSLFSSSSTFNSSLFNTDSDSLVASTESDIVNTTNSAKEQAVSSDSDSNDPEGEKCAICLKKFRKQRIGNPSNCEHNFCVTCLQEWSKSSNTCPVDRSVFETIIVRNEVGGNIMERIEIQSRNFAIFPPVDIEEVLLNDTITCERCGSGEDEETLLLCDLCNLGYHMACLDPPLQAIPAGSWYCPPCRLLNRNPNQNMNEAMRLLIGSLPLSPLVLSSSSMRQNRNQARTGRTRFFGPPPRGRGPNLSHRQRNNNSASDSITNVIESALENHLENVTTNLTHSRRKKRKRRSRKRRNHLNTNIPAQISRNLAEIASSKERISRRLDETLLSSADTRVAARPSEVVDMVFPSFTLFGNDDLNYFSDEMNEDDGLEGEVAIMARVRSEFSARRIQNRKTMVSNLINNYSSRIPPTADLLFTENITNSSNLLDSILESQTLWHSKNVEISSKKDGTLEIKLKKDGGKKPDLSNTKHSSKEIPLYPNKNENSSSENNKSYTSNTRYTGFGGSSGNSSNSFGQSTSSFNALNPSSRPGFSSILGNSSPALDLSPFRGTTPIRFRMNPPRSALRRTNYNTSSSARHSSNNSTSLLNLIQSPCKPSSTAATGSGGGDDDVDLYDDIESDNAENDKIPEMFSSLEPPPEPPALLIGSDSSSDEDTGLVIDDKVSTVNKSNIYDPTEPNEDSDESNHEKNMNIVPGYLRSPSYGGISEFGPHLPLPEPPAPPIELESVNNSESDEEAECPNMTLYSSTSINLANSVQDIPVPDSAYPTMGPEFLDFIPIPSAAPSEEIPLPEEKCKSPKIAIPASELYSPTIKDDSDVSSSDIEEIVSDKSSPHSGKQVQHCVPSGCSSSEEDEFSSEEEKVKPARKASKSVTPEKDIPADESSLDVEIVKSDTEKSDTEKSDTEKSDSEKSDSEKFVDKFDVEGKNKVSTEKQIEKDFDADQTTKKIIKYVIEDVEKNNRVEKEDAVLDKSGKDEEKDEESDSKKSSVDDKVENVTVMSKEDEDSDEPESIDKVEEQVTKKMEEKEDQKDEDELTEIETTISRRTSIEKVENDADVNEADGPKDDDSPEMMKANSGDLSVSNTYLLPSDDLDPVSDVEYNDFPDYQRQVSNKERKKKRKKTRKRDSSVEPSTKTENRELEEGEIEEDRTKKKHLVIRKRRTSESEERLSEKKQKRKRDRKDKGTGKENKETTSKGDLDLTWKKLSKNTKERNYRDGKQKPDKLIDRNRERESTKKKEKRKEIERYDVRKIVSEKPRTMRDEFGRDISVPRTRSRSLSPARSYSSRRRSKGPLRRSFSQDDRWIDWSPVWTQRRSRSRTRRSRSRSRNRSRHSGDRYRNRSKDRKREHDKRESRKRKRSVSSLERYSSEDRKCKRSKEHVHRAGSYSTRVNREMPEYFYDRSWSRSPSYGSISPPPNTYVSRYERSPSIIEPAARIPIVSPEPGLLSPNPTLTVIVPNDVNKKKHKKKKDGKKKKKKQPSKEVFTSGDNIVVSVNFDDNQKIVSAKSSKRKHDDEKSRKKKKDESSRKKRKQTLQVSEEVLNAKPVAVIDLNSSPCKEMSPTEVISLTDSGDENAVNEVVVPVDRRTQEYSEGYQTTENASKSPERRPYVMTSSGPKTPPEPPIKFTVTSTAPIRPLPTNPIFEQDEELEREDDTVHYNKGPNTPPEPSNQTPNATMYDPFEPTKSRSQTPERTEIYKEHQDNVVEGRPSIDIFADDGEKPSDSQSNEKPKPQEDSEDCSIVIPVTEEASVLRPSPAKEIVNSEVANETNQANGPNTLVLDLSSLGNDFVAKSSIPLVKTSQGKYEFQGTKTIPDKPITVVIEPQTTPVKPLPQQVLVTPTRQIPTKPVEPIKQPIFPDILPWKLPPPLSQASFATPPPTVSTVTPTTLITPSKSAPSALAQNGGQDESAFDLDDSPYSPASSEGDDLFEPPPLNASGTTPTSRPAPIPAVNSYKSRVDALFSSSPVKKLPPRPVAHSKPISAIKGSKKVMKAGVGGKKEVSIKADEEQLKILDDVPNSAVEMIVKEKFLKKLHRQERVVEEVKVVLKPHYAKKHLTKEEYKDILRRAVPKICHNKSGDINPSKIQSLVEAYVRKIRHSKKKGPTIPSSTAPPMFPSVTTGKPLMKKPKTLWG